MRETGWLIERSNGGTPEWLFISGDTLNTANFSWTRVATNGLRLCREKDAISLLTRLQRLDNDQHGLRSPSDMYIANISFVKDAKVTEHIWMEKIEARG